MTPEEIRRLVRRIVADVIEVAVGWRWLHSAAYGTSGRGGGGKVAPDENRPTEAAVLNELRADFRDRQREAEVDLQRIRRILEKTTARVRVSYRWRDVLNLPNPAGGGAVTRADYLKLQERQRRRREQGEEGPLNAS